jgi:hypothetical protein
MIDRTVKLRVSRQSIVLGISRGSVYYRQCSVSIISIRLNRWPSARFSRLMILGWVARVCSVIAKYIPNRDQASGPRPAEIGR